MITVLIIIYIYGSSALKGSEVLKNLGEKQYALLASMSYDLV